MKRIRLVAAKLLRKENADPADPADSLLPYTKKRPLLSAVHHINEVMYIFDGVSLCIITVFIRINAPGAIHFATITDKKINSRVQWQWAIMDTYSLYLACQHV